MEKTSGIIIKKATGYGQHTGKGMKARGWVKPDN